MTKVGIVSPAAREVPFFYHVGESLFMRGQIDALVEADKRIIVRDYKYARAAPQLRLYQVQMEAYALAAADAYPQSRVEAEIVFLKDDAVTVPVTLPPLPEIRARMLWLGREIVAAQMSGDYPKKPPSPGECRKLRCGFVERCWSH
jgi:PD-(D/E)XK nuclease superfamily protein